MSAGLEGFLTGFFGARAEGMQRDRDKADAAEERLRNIAQRNSIIAQNRTSMAATAKSMGDQLLSWGATPEQIQAALGSGQAGLADLYKTVSTVHSTLDADEAKRFLGTVGADLGAAGAVGKEGLDNLYKSTFGLPMGMKTGDYKAPEESTLAKLFGYTDRKAKMMQNLDEEMSGVGGYSVYDLTTIGELPDYMPGSAGENIMYKAPSIYTQAKYSDSIQDVDSSLRLMESSDAYKNASKNITGLSDKIQEEKLRQDPNEETLKNLEKLKLEEEQKINSMRDNVIKEAVLTQSNSYFNSDTYLEDMSRYVTNSLGYTPSWMPDLIESEKEVNAIVNQSLGGGLVGEYGDQTAAALAGVDPVVAKPTVINTIKSEAGKELNVVEVDGKTLVQTTGGTLMSEEDSAEVIAAAEEAGTATKVSYTSKVGEMPAVVDTYEMPDVTSPKDKAAAARKQASVTAAELEDAYDIAVDATDTVREVSTGAIKTTADFVDRWVLGASVGYMQKPIATMTSGLAWLSDKAGFKDLADGLYVAAYDQAKGADDMIEKGFFENLMDTAGSSEYPESTFVNGMVEYLQPSIQKPMGEVSEEESAAMLDALKENLSTMYGAIKKIKPTPNEDNPMIKSIESLVGKPEPKTTEAEPDYAAAAMRAKDHLETLGEQAKSVAKDLSSAISKAVSKAQTTAQEARTAKAALQEQGVTTEGMSERETIEAYDRQFLSDWKNMPVALKTIVLGSMVGKDKGMTEEETIRDLDRQFIMDWEGMPVQNKTIIRDVLYGKRVESFTEEQNKRLNEMRQTNPDWFIDTPPLGLPVPDASEVDTTFKSRTDRPTGMMSPLPAQRAGLEATPALGDTELDSMLTRIHGEGSADMQKFMNKVHTGKVKAADVTRIINSTKKLPKTTTRAKVLEKLYELRDSIK